MARPLSTALSASQKKIAQILAAFERRGEPAFVSSLVAALRLAAESSLMPTLKIMERNGFAEIRGGGEHGKARIVRLTHAGKVAIGAFVGIPLVGRIRAGPLQEAIAEPEEMITDLDDLLGYRLGDFLLRVEGDSMEPKIPERSLVLLRPDVQVQSGEVAAVIVNSNHEATLKQVLFKPGKRRVTLHAFNPEYDDIQTMADEIKIAGVFRRLISEVVK